MSFVLVPVVTLVLRRTGVVDVPNNRSSHAVVTPRGGGVAVGLSMLTGIVLSSRNIGQVEIVLLAGATVLGVVGFCDDVRGLDARLRLVMQATVAAIGAAVVARSFDPHAVTVAAVIVLLVGFTNAFNFMDGINGISALFAIWSGTWLAILAGRGAPEWLLVYGLALAGAAGGFLPWNLSGRVFLGDVGSYFIGFAIAGGVLVAALSGAGWLESLAVLAIYCADTSWAVLKRVRRGSSWRAAHKEHVYQRLVDAGLRHPVVATIVCGATVITSIASLAPWPTPWRLGLIALICYLYVCLPRLFLHNRIAVG
jgi:UDP-N-acetylmuramyl pentapeptide phosphotransferase/UDP-N-acetylglucosamine-1-phosphate transferase